MRLLHFGPVRDADKRERGQGRRTRRLACLMALTAMLLVGALPQAANAESELSTVLGATSELVGSAGPEISLTPSTTTPYTPCPPGGLMIECNIVIDPPVVETSAGYALPGGGPLLEGGGEKGGFDPTDLQSAYKIPTSGGSGETVALVDAYGYAAAESDLAKYREKYGLAPCVKSTGCFKKVNQKGEEANYPAESGALEKDWSLETALDMDMVSAACPNCKIMLVEATTQGPKDTAASVEEAATLKANEISNSYGYSENEESWCPSKKGCKEYLPAYNQAGIPVTVSAGDSGYDDSGGAPSWPATSPNVIAVGGTTLKKAEGTRGWAETVWKGSGSGCSLYESKPAWQTDKGCAKRTDNDVAAIANNETPVSIYNTPYAGGWFNVGGTSVSSPFVAGVEAHATSGTKKLGADAFYKKPSMLFDVTSGNNGTCTPPTENEYLCTAKTGYDGPTGWGTPDGVFAATAAPSVTTGAATSVTETGATLNGTVNPNGLETKYSFEYGTTESYGSKTAEASAGSGESNVEESKAVTGLTLGTTYDFRITATNSEGTTHGTNQKVTPSGKPTVETKAATSIGEAEATLNGSVNAKGAETKYYFEYGTTESYGSKTAEVSAGSGITSLEESKAITGLTASTTYDFRIVATNAHGTTDGSNQVFSTAGKPSVETKPATGVTETETTLNGVVNPRGAETKYYFAYGTTESYGSTTAEASAGSGIGSLEESKTITGLTKGTQYHFRVVATNSHGTVDGGDRTFITHGPPVNTALPVATPTTPDQAVLESTTTGTWANEPTSYAYQWELCNATGGECANITGATSSTFTPVEADVGHTLVVKVTAKNSGGESAALSKATNQVEPIGQITEYSLPTGSAPMAIAAGPDGNLWFNRWEPGDTIGKMTTAGTVTEYAIPSKNMAYDITAGPDENLWFVVPDVSKIGKSTTSGTITEYSLPINSSPTNITTGSDGNLWFTDYESQKIGKITTSGTITEYALPAGSYPDDITPGPGGNLWFTNVQSKKIGKITTSGTITEYPLPAEAGAPYDIAEGADGNLWFTELLTGKIGRITTSGTVTEYSLPKESEPFGIVAGPDGNLWFTEIGANGKIGKITTSGTVTEYSLPKESSPWRITVGPDENIWFTESSSNKIGKITP